MMITQKDIDIFWEEFAKNKPPPVEPKFSMRASILQEAANVVKGDREDTYGGPEDSFQNIARLWEAYTTREFSTTDVAIMLALLKIARIKRSPAHRDSWVDLAGYAACGAECGLGKHGNPS